MRRNKGFTLIEVMVVLSILALIAILAYNFFGNTMKEARLTQAATKIYNDFRVINDALELFYQKNGRWPTRAEVNNDNILVTSGVLKAMPSGDQSWKVNGSFTYDWDPSFDNMDGGTVNDAALAIYYTSSTLCSEYNKRYAIGPLNDGTIFDYDAAGGQYPGQNLGKSHRTYSIKWDTAATECEIEWIVQYND